MSTRYTTNDTHAAHTPGPWKVMTTNARRRFARFELLGPDREVIAAVIYNDAHNVSQANAALIARAPDLLDQVQSLQATLNDAVALCESQRKEIAAQASIIARDSATIANLRAALAGGDK